tara:strand:- start:555 stop:734 length:180 start_codon:yes stop_codon:yes gene_type:complete
MSDLKEAVLLVFLGLGLGFGWYKLWVEPQDQWRHEVLDCMNGDRSQEAYDWCVAELRRP